MTIEKGKSLGNKVVLAKLPREEFTRFQHYCELKGETINAAIRRIVMTEVDKPQMKASSTKNTKNLMFDTNSFDKILSGEIPIELIRNSINLGYRYFITHIQTDELSNIPDNKKDKRAKLVLFLSAVAPSLIPTESFVLGYTRLGYGKLGTAGYYEKLLNESKTNIKDAIIGDTAIKNGFIIVTEDNKFIKKIESLGGNAITPKDFTDSLQNEGKK
jgi:predicted nucleic acid-binding protein